jgi:hemolysin D
MSKLAPELADFAPGLLSIQESPPQRFPRLVFYVVACFVALLLLWAFLAKLDIVVVAEGRLVPQTYLKIVQPSDAGRLSEILVREGDEVKAGQVIVRLDPAIGNADYKTLDADVTLKELTMRRIDAELAGAPFLSRVGDDLQRYQQVLQQYQSHRQAYIESVEQESAALARVKNELNGAKEMQAKLQEIVPIYQQAEAAHKKLVVDGFVAEIAMREKERERIEKERDLKAQLSAVASLQNAITQSEKKLAQVKSNYESQLLNERIEITSQTRKLKGELTKQTIKNELLELRAPQSGVVKDLATSTVGTVVQPGLVLLTIVPKNEPLLAEIAVRNEDVGFMSVGQGVKLKLSSYAFQKYGMLDGKVLLLGADASSPQDQVQRMGQSAQNSSPQAFRALVKLDQQVLNAPNGALFRLTAGMQVSAEIKQSQRTVMEYLLSPVQKVQHEAGRER